MKKLIAILTFLTVFLSGCTTTQLTVHKVKKGKQPAQSGIVYFLPTLEVGIEHDRMIQECQVMPTEGMLATWIQQELKNLSKILDELTLRSEDENPATFQQAFDDLLGEGSWLALTRNFTLPDQFSDGRKKISSDNVKQLVVTLSNQIFVPAHQAHKLLWPENFTQNEWGQVDGIDPRRVQTPTEKIAEANIKILHATRFAPRYTADSDHVYAMDYQELRKAFKKTEISVEKHANGSLKSINADIQDRTAQVVSSSVSGILRLAAAAYGIPAPASEALPALDAVGIGQSDDIRLPILFEDYLDFYLDSFQICKPSILNTLDRRKELLKKLEPGEATLRRESNTLTRTSKMLEEKQKALAKEQVKLSKLEESGAAAEEIEAVKQKIASLESEVKSLRGQVIKTRKEIANVEQQLKADRAKLAAENKKLTHTTVFTYRPEAQRRQQMIDGLDEASEQWFLPEQRDEYCQSEGVTCVTSDTCEGAECSVAHPASVSAYIATYLAPGSESFSSEPQPELKHLVYREPIAGLVLVCKQEECIDDAFDIRAQRKNIVLEKSLTIPQLGILATLPLVNESFSNENLVASFREDGALLTFTYTGNARAEAAAQSFSDTAGSVGDYLDARREADKLKLDQATAELEAERARLEAELAVERARQELEEFRGDESGDEE